MTRGEFQSLSTFLRGLYGESFPDFTSEMAQLWYEDLVEVDYALAVRAVKRWARRHRLKVVPTLDELLEVVEWVKDDERRGRPKTTVSKPAAQILAEAEARARKDNPAYTTEDHVWGKLMIRLLQAVSEGLPRSDGTIQRYTMADCAGQCWAWARYYQTKSAGLARDLERHAQQYEDLARKEPMAAVVTPPATMPHLMEPRAMPPAAIQEEGCSHEHVNEAGTACLDCGEVLCEAAAD